ncbi:MAG: hypothetical protein WDM90_08895 [Ferruginibacter sp.]
MVHHIADAVAGAKVPPTDAVITVNVATLEIVVPQAVVPIKRNFLPLSANVVAAVV